MGYKNVMMLAGATVHDFENFGSYQGDWWAFVTYKGVTGFVNGSFGSCSGCDAFQSEFESVVHYHDKVAVFGGLYESEEFKDDCDECKNTKQRLIEFGEKYLDGIMSKEEAIEYSSRNLSWDLDAKEMVDWIKGCGV